jgi:hypothetical protein
MMPRPEARCATTDNVRLLGTAVNEPLSGALSVSRFVVADRPAVRLRSHGLYAGVSRNLLTLIENRRALSFFEKMGFRKHGDPTLIAGMRGKGGERLHQQIMVWSEVPLSAGVLY